MTTKTTKPASSVSVQDYLKAIYRLTVDQQPATTKRLARHLGHSDAAVTQMIKHLAERGWVKYAPYRGVKLTAEGFQLAEEIIRHHRLLERYLCDHLGYDPEEVHQEAERLEHHISEEFEERIARLMNEPETCPHGQPIPPRADEDSENQ